MRYFTNVHDLGDLKTALAEAFEIKKDRYKYENLGKHKTCLLIFFNNSLRTRLSTQKAARNLGMDVIVLDVNQGAWKLETERGVIMDGDKSEHLLEAIPVMASYCDIIGVRSFAHFENREDDYTEKILNQFIKYSGKPVFSMEAATGHPLQAFADLITIEEYKKKERPKVVLTWAPHPRALPQAVPNSFADWMNEADVDFVITFEELTGMFEAKGIDITKVEEETPIMDATSAGRGYAASGGVASAIEKCVQEYYPDTTVHIEHVESLADCKKILMLAKLGKKNGCLIEGMACPGGCIAGAGTNVAILQAQKALSSFQNEAERKLPPQNAMDEAK